MKQDNYLPQKSQSVFDQIRGLYPWPYDGAWKPAEAALIVVDMQRDFLDPAGWYALTRGDHVALAAIVPAVAETIRLSRLGGLRVMYTVEGHRPDLSDLPANKQWRAKRLGQAIGSAGPLGRHLVLGEPGTAIVQALAPKAAEPVVAKPGKSGFIGSDLDHILRRQGVRNLIFAGVTTDGAVQCTLRDANDRGYECLILEDATASDIASHHADQIHTLSLAGGHYGSVGTVKMLAAAMQKEAA